jgi:hypothetical protein
LLSFLSNFSMSEAKTASTCPLRVGACICARSAG